MTEIQKTQQTPPTQELIEADRVERDTLILKNGNVRKIILVSGVNFELRSEEEQSVLIAAYQSFLNALDFSIQIFIHSRKINIEGYVHELESKQRSEPNALIASMMEDYRGFITALVGRNPIMEKQFFVVVPYDPPPDISGTGKTIAQAVFGLFNRTETTPPPPRDLGPIFIQLEQRAEQIVNGLSRIGLRAIALNTDELIELFYNVYNPEAVERHLS